MRTTDRETSVLIRDLCERLGKWADRKVYQPLNGSTMTAIREDAERLVDLLNARELNLYRAHGMLPSGSGDEEG